MARLAIIFGCVLAATSAFAQPAAGPPAFFDDAQQDDKLRALVSALAKGDDKAEASAFSDLVAEQHAAGWVNLFAHSRVLERKGEEWLESEPERAMKAADHARDLAPSSLAAQWLYVRAKYATEGVSAGPLFRELKRAFKLAVSDFPVVVQLASNAIFALIAVILLACLAFLAFSVIKHLRYVAHDLGLVLPAGATHWHGLALAILVLCLPLAFRLGIVGVAMAMFLPPIVHSETRERVVATMTLIFIALLPFAFSLVAWVWTLPAGRARDMYDVTRGHGSAAAELRLGRDMKRLDDANVHIALGTALLQRGEYAGARLHFEIATKKDSRRYDAWVQLGVCEFQLDHQEEAKLAFEHAVENNANSIPALFDLSRLYFREAAHEKGNQAHTRAQALDPERTNAIVGVSRVLGQRYMVQEVLPLRELWRADPYPSERLQAQATEDSLIKAYCGGFAPWMLAVAAGLWIVLGWVLAIFGQRAVPALPCPRCGRPVCVHTDKDLPDRSLCGQCYHAFVLNDVDTGTRIGKEMECLRHERWRATFRRAASVLLAGSGHVFAGHSLRGFILLLIAFTAALTVAFGTSLLPLPMRWGNAEASSLGLGLALSVWLIVSLSAALTVPTKD